MHYPAGFNLGQVKIQNCIAIMLISRQLNTGVTCYDHHLGFPNFHLHFLNSRSPLGSVSPQPHWPAPSSVSLLSPSKLGNHVFPISFSLSFPICNEPLFTYSIHFCYCFRWEDKSGPCSKNETCYHWFLSNSVANLWLQLTNEWSSVMNAGWYFCSQ